MDPILYSEKDKEIFESLQKQGPLGKRALFIFQYLFLRKEFKLLVKKIREELQIPENGFNPRDKKDQSIFLDKYLRDYGFDGGEIIFQKKINLSSEKLDVRSSIEKYVEQCGILAYTPNMYFADGFIQAIIKEYILFNGFVGLYKGNFALASIASYEYDTNGTEAQMEPMELRLEIPISTKKEELKDYLDSVWSAIEFAKKKVLKEKDFVRFRPRNNFIRDLNILNKYIELEKLSVSQRKERGIGYIEVAVKRELVKEGFKNIPDEGTIRSIVSRLKNEIKDKNVFWEQAEEYNNTKTPSENSDLGDF